MISQHRHNTTFVSRRNLVAENNYLKITSNVTFEHDECFLPDILWIFVYYVQYYVHAYMRSMHFYSLKFPMNALEFSIHLWSNQIFQNRYFTLLIEEFISTASFVSTLRYRNRVSETRLILSFLFFSILFTTNYKYLLLVFRLPFDGTTI